MSTQKIKAQFKVAKNGDVSVVDVLGVGSGCQSFTKGVEQALGIVDERTREATAAAYQDVDPIKLINNLG
jgi:hypothetical protein